MRKSFIVVGAVVAVLLTGCTAGPKADDAAATRSPSASQSASAVPSASATDQAGGAQTKTEACTIMQQALSGFTALNDPAKQAELKADPAKALATFQKLQDEMDAAAAKVTNDEVGPSAHAAAAAVHDYFDFIRGLTQDPSKVGEMGDHISTLTNAMVSLQKTCV